MLKPDYKSFLIALLMLCSVAVAAPRVALIRVNSGSATLDGKAFKTAQMAAEGQTLKLAADSQVRIQLLGSSSEVTLAGPLEMKISKSQLDSEAKKVTRGGVAVALDIGNRNTAGSLVTRSASPAAPVNTRRTPVRPKLPPVKKDGALMIPFDCQGAIKLPPGAEVGIEINPLDETSDKHLEAYFENELPVIELAPDAIVEGEGYEFILAYYSDDATLARYTQTFRILTPEQREFLAAADEEMLKQYNEQKSVLPLLRLASLYQDMDQNAQVLKYLEMAHRSPFLKQNDNELQKKLEKLISKFENSLNMNILVVQG